MPPPTGVPSTAEQAVAWGGAAAFVASLCFFLFSFDVTFTRDLEGAVDVRTVVLDTALFSVFALHHSVFARLGVRTWIQQRQPTLERSVYVWIASLLLILVCVLWQPVPGVLWQVYEFPAWLLRLAHLCGVALSVGSAAAIDIWDLAGVRQISGAGSREPASARSASARSRRSLGEGRQDPAYSEFRTTGPYGLVRHPIYLGWFLIVFGVPHMTATRFVFAVVSSVYVLIAIPLEERSLLATTNGAYERYKQKVRFRLIPRIY